MKSYSYFLLFLVLLASCQKKHKPTRPIIFNATANEHFPVYLIIGSDTQQVDSVYNKYYYRIFYRGYGSEDSFFTNIIVRKYYIFPGLENRIDNYIYNYFKPCIKCKIYEIYVANYYYVTATDPDGDSIQCCLYDQRHAMSFYYGLKKLIEKSPDYNDANKLLIDNLGPMINAECFFPTPKDSAKALMNASEKDKTKSLEMLKQKREKYKKQFEWARKIDSIKAVIAKGQTKDKQVD